MRRRVALAAAGLLLGLAAIWAVPTPAYACSCAQTSDEGHVSRADVIFTGRIEDDRSDQQTRILTFVVERIYKGSIGTRQVISTSASGASCGLEIGGEGTFLVFANHADQPGQLEANLCGGTRPGGAPAILGEGRPPQPESASPSDPAGPAPPAAKPNTGPLLLIIGVVIIIAAFRVAARARRREAR